jgi:hypothetical protein
MPDTCATILESAVNTPNSNPRYKYRSQRNTLGGFTPSFDDYNVKNFTDILRDEYRI